jgi:hypothetical protein
MQELYTHRGSVFQTRFLLGFDPYSEYNQRLGVNNYGQGSANPSACATEPDRAGGEMMDTTIEDAAARGQGYEAGLAMIQAMVDAGDIDPMTTTPEIGFLIEALRQISFQGGDPETEVGLLTQMANLLPPTLNLSFLSNPKIVTKMADAALTMTDEEMARREKHDQTQHDERMEKLNADPTWVLMGKIGDRMDELDSQITDESQLSPDEWAFIDDFLSRRGSGNVTPEDLDRLNALAPQSAGQTTPPSEMPISPMRHRHHKGKGHHKTQDMNFHWYPKHHEKR